MVSQFVHDRCYLNLKWEALESDPNRKEMFEYLCFDIPFKLDIDNETLNTALWKAGSEELSLTVTETPIITSNEISEAQPAIKDEM